MAITVEVTAKAYEQGAQYVGGDASPVTVEIQLTPTADSYGEAIVRGLRHSADVAATRLGYEGTAERVVPVAVAGVIDDIVTVALTGARATGDPLLSWARRLAAEYGMKLTIDEGR